MADRSTTKPLRELWSAADQAALSGFDQALASCDLVHGLLMIEGAEPDAVHDAMEQLATLGARVREQLDRGQAPAHALQHVLGTLEDFQGDTEDYYHPRNSHLSVVLTRRRGTPILLSAVWIAVGALANIAIEGVNMPGHFIIRLLSPDDGESVLLDPFMGGRPISVEECSHLITELSQGRLPWDDHFLDAVPLCGFFERVLRNLIHSHERRQDVVQLYRCVRFIKTLRPDDAETHILHAHLAEAIGAHRLAITSYEDIVDRFGNCEECRVAAARLRKLLAKSRLIN